MFMTMVAPLFIAAMMILDYEPSKTHRNDLVRLYRGLFKQFMGLAKRTTTELVDEMIGKDLLDIAREECQVAKEKWESISVILILILIINSLFKKGIKDSLMLN